MALRSALVIALALVAWPSPVSGTSDSLQVPTGQVGDQVVYAMFQRSGPSVEDRPWIPRGGQLVELVRLTETLDRTGNARPVAVYATNQSANILLVSRDPASGGPSPSSTTYEHVDLATRAMVRRDIRAADLAIASFEPSAPSLRGLDYQGRVLRPAEDLSYTTTAHHVPRLDVAIYLSFEFPMLLGGISLGVLERMNLTLPELLPPGTEVRRWVHQEGVVHAQAAYGIRSEYSVEIPREGAGVLAQYAGGRFHVVQDEWVSASSAYVLMVQTRAAVEDASGTVAWVTETVHDLAKLTPGSGDPVVWRTDCCTAPAPERQRTEGLPADGEGPGLAFAAADAIQAAGRDPMHIAFMAQHPDAEVVAARLQRGALSEAAGVNARSLVWTLCWRASDGSSHAVEVERRDGLPVATTRGKGCATAGAQAVPPAAPITFVEAARRARLVWPHEADPDFVVWGDVSQDSFGTECFTSMGGPPSPEELETRPYRVLAIGWSETGSCHAPGRKVTHQVFLDTETGRPLWALQSAEGFDRALPLLSSPAPATPAEAHAFASAFPALPVSVMVFGGSLAAVAVAMAVLRGLVPIAGFSKLRAEDLLDHPVRNTLLEAIRSDPGIHSAGLARKAGVSWGTARHHLRLMEKANLVSSIRSGRTRSWFVRRDAMEGQAAVALRNPVSARILARVRAHPGTTVQQVASEVEITTAGVLWHLQRLETAGLLRRRKVGRSVHLHAASPVQSP